MYNVLGKIVCSCVAFIQVQGPDMQLYTSGVSRYADAVTSLLWLVIVLDADSEHV